MNEQIEHIIHKSSELSDGQRFMLGIVGFPGAGKSTTAQNLVTETNAKAGKEIAVVVPMDGFHLPNKVLDERNLRPLKGIPETFDGEEFVALLKRIRKAPAQRVMCPAFDRSLDESSPDAIAVQQHHKVVVVEGNYLLLQESPWNQIGELMDEVWYLDVKIDTIIPRLIERHVLGGRTEQSAREKMESTDLRNARLIEQTRGFANRVVTL